MNQILISEKLYVTQEMKKKKKVFKIEFIISVFLLCILTSYAIYAEYDRNKSEQVSKEILSGIEFNTGEITDKDKVVVVVLNEALKDNSQANSNVKYTTAPSSEQSVASDGTVYSTIGIINIPSINVYYPILSTTTTALLKISPCKFWGANPNEVGNLCIVGHNYRNSKFFSKIQTLENGSEIEITDLSGKTLTYSVYDKYVVDPDDVKCTSQATNGKREVTLITCTNDNARRCIIKAREK
jgi:LPXTG-site transpeptidase (sortase) family protein